jgi:hypothetical protein
VVTTTISATAESAQYWAAKPFVTDALRSQVAAADILLVPNEGYQERDIRFFPSGTTQFFDYLRRSVPPDVVVEACIEDSDYREVARHADELYIAWTVVKLFAAPLFVNLLAEYIKRKFGKKTADVTLKTSIAFHDDTSGKTLRLDYDGPADAFEETALATLRQITDSRQPEPRNAEASTGTNTGSPTALPEPSEPLGDKR